MRSNALLFERDVVTIVGHRVGRQAQARGADIQDIGRQQGIERNVVADHADDRRRVVVQIGENVEIAVGPRRGEVFQRNRRERIVVHRRVGGIDRRAARDTVDVVPHGCQYRVGWRYAGQPVVHALGLFERSATGRHGGGEQNDEDQNDMDVRSYSQIRN